MAGPMGYRSLSAVLMDPLMAGLWGVLLQIASVSLGLSLLRYGAQLTTWVQSVCLLVGLTLFLLSSWMLYRCFQTCRSVTSVPGGNGLHRAIAIP